MEARTSRSTIAIQASMAANKLSRHAARHNLPRQGFTRRWLNSDSRHGSRAATTRAYRSTADPRHLCLDCPRCDHQHMPHIDRNTNIACRAAQVAYQHIVSTEPRELQPYEQSSRQHSHEGVGGEDKDEEMEYLNRATNGAQPMGIVDHRRRFPTTLRHTSRSATAIGPAASRITKERLQKRRFQRLVTPRWCRRLIQGRPLLTPKSKSSAPSTEEERVDKLDLLFKSLRVGPEASSRGKY